jgi:SAM-dependent methyltransferase
MNLRIRCAKRFISLGKFIQSLAVVLMRPDDLVKFSRQTYAKPDSIASFTRRDLLFSGFNEIEEKLILKIPFKRGRILIIGVGGGREALPLARLDFEVHGVDFVEAMAESARHNLIDQGLNIEVSVQELSRIEFPPDSFDIIWFSPDLYSAIPTRKRRVEMLKRVKSMLRPGGYALLQFQWKTEKNISAWKEIFKKLFAGLTLGNLKYETGDILWRNGEFIHTFVSVDALKSELERSGMDIVHIEKTNGQMKGGALLRKP